MEKQANETPQEELHRILALFGSHCGDIMCQPSILAFGIGLRNGPSVVVEMKITTYQNSDGTADVWDSVKVNGKNVGNRCGARNEYARLCAPIIAAASLACSHPTIEGL